MRYYHPAPTEWKEISIVRCPVATYHFNCIWINCQPVFPESSNKQSLINDYVFATGSPISPKMSVKLPQLKLFPFFRAGSLFELLGYKFKQVNRNA